MIRLVARFALLAFVGLIHVGAAHACSCGSGPTDLADALQSALVDSDHVYVAHVVAVDQRATLKVAERFKGNVKVGESLRVRSGGGGDCTLRFTAGERYLVYTTGAPESVFLCSRTRRLRQDDDAELKWLRSKILPPLPAVLQRQEVTCQACDVYSVSGSLIGPSVSGTCNLPLLGEKDVAAGVATGKPFWAKGYADGSDPGHAYALGLTWDGRSFELVQAPADNAPDACRQQVQRRWCSALELSTPKTPGDPPLRCLDAGPWEDVCDEASTRESRWLPVESLKGADCRWRDPAVPSCTLAKTPVPAAVDGKVLQCTPDPASSRVFQCRVVDEPQR